MPNLTEESAASARQDGPSIMRLGGDIPIFRIGYGAMRIVGQPGNWGPPKDRVAAHRVLRRAVDLGVNFIDTADAYGPGISEALIAEALFPYPPGLVIATKGGMVKRGPNPGQTNPDGRPEHVRAACEASLRRLKLDCISLYQLHRVDPHVPLAETLGAFVQLRDEGKIRHVGLSNVSAVEFSEACRIVDIASVQNRYSLDPGVRSDGADALVELCASTNVAFIPWGPLAADPRAIGTPYSTSRADTPAARIAGRLGVTPAQVALAWLLHRSATMLPIPGTSSLEHVAQNVGAAALSLSAMDMAELAP